ncbi:hypothetical protein IGJ55_003005 [Enterococcus sp. AZ170]|uniref:hypothetical protein n=1 Tax=unclassified Enterococcus TaxID=2608891 RepID=UPI003D28D0AF
MSIYVWIAASGVIGLIALLVFVGTFLKDRKSKKKLGYSFNVLLLNYLLLLVSIGSFSLMVYLFVSVKNQLMQLGG